MTSLAASTCAPTAESDPLRIVAVGKRHVILSTGVELFVRFEKLAALCEQLWQESSPITVRTWWTDQDGTMVEELIEVHRLTSSSTAASPPTSSEAF